MQRTPPVMLLRSRSQPNSEFQVNNNAWICRHHGQSLPEHSKPGLATRLLFEQMPRFLNTQPGVKSQSSPAVSPPRLNVTHNIQGQKYTTNVLYLKEPEDGEAIPLLEGFVSH